MKKYIAIILGIALVCSCTEKTETSKAGKRVGEIYVTALPGAKTVLVNQDGLWRVRTSADWISLDVNGREGPGAFTMYYASNESDFVNSNPSRRGAVIIESLRNMRADTLWLRQQGVPDGKEYSSSPQDSYIEFIDSDADDAKEQFERRRRFVYDATAKLRLIIEENRMAKLEELFKKYGPPGAV